MVSFRSSLSLGVEALFVSARIRAITSPARLPSRTMSACSFPGFVQVGHICGQPAEAGAAVADDTGKRLIDFMRDRGGQFPHHAHAVDVRELCLEFAQPLALLFGTLAVFDVGENSIPPDDLSVLIAQRHTTSQKPAIFPVCSATKARFGFEWLASSKGRTPLLPICLTIFRVNCVRPT